MYLGQMKVLICVMVLVGVRQSGAQPAEHWVGSWATSQQIPETAESA